MNSFETETKKELEKRGWVWRIPSGDINFQSPKKVPTPADFLWLHQGKVYFIECKATESNRFRLRNITSSQWEAAFQISMNGGNYYFVIKIQSLVGWIPFRQMSLMRDRASLNQEMLELFPPIIF